MLIAKGPFLDLASRLLEDQSGGSFTPAIFALGVSTGVEVGSAKENERYHELLTKSLRELARSGEISFEHALDSIAARSHVDAFLEVTSYNFGRISYSVATLHDSSDEIISIVPLEKPTLVQRALGIRGASKDGIHIRRSEIVELVGDAFEFKISVQSGVRFFIDSSGIREISRSCLENP